MCGCDGYVSPRVSIAGEFLNLSYWADLLNATGRPVLIESMARLGLSLELARAAHAFLDACGRARLPLG
jgi:hypothetical protein